MRRVDRSGDSVEPDERVASDVTEQDVRLRLAPAVALFPVGLLDVGTVRMRFLVVRSLPDRVAAGDSENGEFVTSLTRIVSLPPPTAFAT